MTKFTDQVKTTLQGYFNLGDVPTEAQYAELMSRIQEGIQEHGHKASGGEGSETGDAGPVINLQSGTAAQRPANPEVGDVYLETDTSKVYACFTTGAWTDITGGTGGAPDDASYVTISAEDGLSAETLHKNITGEDLHDPKAHGSTHAAGQSDPVPAATTDAAGIVELATVEEAQAGTDTTRAVVPAGLLMRKTDTAIIGGDLTGDTRGNLALDIQSTRGASEQVASGEKATAIGLRNIASGLRAVAVGSENTASGDYSTAIGYHATASGNYSIAAGRYNTAGDYSSVAVGSGNTASGYYGIAVGIANTASAAYSVAFGLYNSTWSDYSMAIGYQSTTLAEKSNAIGYGAKTGVPTTTNICGPQIIRKDRGENASYTFYSFCGVEVVLMSKEVDLKTVADQTITLPTGCRFWLDEIGVIATNIDGLTTQPTVRFGITGDLDKHHTAAITTKLTATGKREKFSPLVPEDGETSLTAGVTVAAAGTTVKGRFYWKGMLVENE